MAEKKIFKKFCMKCRVGYDLTVDLEKFNRWTKGEGHIQDMLPGLTIDERELLISGVCGKCFDKMFNE